MTGIKQLLFSLSILLLISACSTTRMSLKYGDSTIFNSVDINISENESGQVIVQLQNESSEDIEIFVNPWMVHFSEKSRELKGYKTVTVCEGDVCKIKKVPIYSNSYSYDWKDWQPASESITVPAGKSVSRIYKSPSSGKQSSFIEFISGDKKEYRIIIRVY